MNHPFCFAVESKLLQFSILLPISFSLLFSNNPLFYFFANGINTFPKEFASFCFEVSKKESIQRWIKPSASNQWELFIAICTHRIVSLKFCVESSCKFYFSIKSLCICMWTGLSLLPFWWLYNGIESDKSISQLSWRILVCAWEVHQNVCPAWSDRLHRLWPLNLELT